MSRLAHALGLIMVWLATTAALAEEIRWRRKTLDAENINEAAAIVDVDHDGKLDVIAGGFWYAAPEWKRRFVGEVENIRGRNDDYSALPLDVNEDGWLDLVCVNYRSKSVYWVEHPGEAFGTIDKPWARHVIDTPGASETGRLYDIDGDGRLDVLPNGTDFAAWYSVSLEESDGIRKPVWQREILGALAPRPVFIAAPVRDDNFDVGGVKKCVSAAGEIYKAVRQGVAFACDLPGVRARFSRRGARAGVHIAGNCAQAVVAPDRGA